MHKRILRTKDNHRIAAVHHTGGHAKAVVLAHGFFNNKDVHLFREMAQAIAKHYDVVVFDFRGHGQSSGLFSWTSRESADIQAVLAYVQECGYASVGVMGFSLGAAISLIEASRNADIKTVIAVSAPYDFWRIDYHFWKPGMLKDLKLNLGHKGRGKGVLPGNFCEPKIAPVSIVDKISPRPVLFIHGKEDWLIHPRHSTKLFQHAREPKRLEIIEGAGHAEKIFDEYPDIFMDMCLTWFKTHL